MEKPWRKKKARCSFNMTDSPFCPFPNVSLSSVEHIEHPAGCVSALIASVTAFRAKTVNLSIPMAARARVILKHTVSRDNVRAWAGGGGVTRLGGRPELVGGDKSHTEMRGGTRFS